MAELVVVQEVAAPVERVWDVLTDWDVHDRWMLFTRAEGVGPRERRSRPSPGSAGSASWTRW